MTNELEDKQDTDDLKVLEHGFIFNLACTHKGEVDKSRLQVLLSEMFSKVPEDISNVKLQFSEPRFDIESYRWVQMIGIRWWGQQ